jgi:hypothetical protein
MIRSLTAAALPSIIVIGGPWYPFIAAVLARGSVPPDRSGGNGLGRGGARISSQM